MRGLGVSTGIGLFILLVIALTVAQTSAPSSSVERREVTIVAETPTGLKTESSVIGLRSTANPWWYRMIGAPQHNLGFEGEAPYIDLGDGNHLFVPLADDISVRHLEPRPRTFSVSDFFDQYENLEDPPPNHSGWPMLIAFTDLNDPRSAVEVAGNNIADHFGPGYHLRAVTVVETDNDVTWGNLDRFPSLIRTNFGRLVLTQGKRE